MLRSDLIHRGIYFDTFYIFDTEKGHYIGVIEDHDRQVKHRYFVGWKFKDNHFKPHTNQPGKTKDFYNFAEALEYIQGEW